MKKLIHLTVCLFAPLLMSGTSLNGQTNAGTLDFAVAPPLADRISADTLVYVGWSGMDALLGQARPSPLSELWTNEPTADVVFQLLPRVLKYVNSENPHMARQMQELWRIALGLRDYPTGFYFAGMTREKDGLPFPLLGFISCVRDDADAVMARLSFVDHLGHDLNLPIRVQSNDGIVRVSLGDTPSSGKMLSDLPEFKSLASYQTNIPALWTYVNVARLPEIVERSAQALPRLAAVAAGRWNAWKQSLALDEVDGFLWSAGFENGQWVTRGNLLASARRRGLTRELDMQPIADKLLQTVPATASLVGAFQVRPDIGLPALEGCLRRADSSAATRLDEGNRLAKSVFGAEPRIQLTKALGNQWAYYCDQNVGGRGLDGLVFVNLLRDANGFRTWLPPIMALLKSDPASVTNGVRAQQLETDGLSLWRVELSGSAVVLGVCETYLILSRRIETVMTACGSVREVGSSILDQDAFQAMRERLGTEAAGAFWYADLCQSTSLPQQAWSAFDELYRTVARTASFNAPVLPSPWKPVSKYLGPAGIFLTTDDRGWHLLTSGPFPGAAVITEPMVLLAPATLAAGPVTDMVYSLRGPGKGVAGAAR